MILSHRAKCDFCTKLLTEATIVGWPELERTLITRSLLEMVDRLSALGHADAATKYAAFLRTYPAWPTRCRSLTWPRTWASPRSR